METSPSQTKLNFSALETLYVGSWHLANTTGLVLFPFKLLWFCPEIELPPRPDQWNSFSVCGSFYAYLCACILSNVLSSCMVCFAEFKWTVTMVTLCLWESHLFLGPHLICAKVHIIQNESHHVFSCPYDVTCMEYPEFKPHTTNYLHIYGT